MCGRRKSLRFEDVWQRKIAEASAAEGSVAGLAEASTAEGSVAAAWLAESWWALLAPGVCGRLTSGEGPVFLAGNFLLDAVHARGVIGFCCWFLVLTGYTGVNWEVRARYHPTYSSK